MKDYDQARKEISELQSQLQSERTRLQYLANEQSNAARTKSTLEARLHTSESVRRLLFESYVRIWLRDRLKLGQELKSVKDELENAPPISSDSLHRLKAERSSLVSERVDLLSRLAKVNEVGLLQFALIVQVWLQNPAVGWVSSCERALID